MIKLNKNDWILKHFGIVVEKKAAFELKKVFDQCPKPFKQILEREIINYLDDFEGIKERAQLYIFDEDYTEEIRFTIKDPISKQSWSLVREHNGNYVVSGHGYDIKY